jgi:hypothetical protein
MLVAVYREDRHFVDTVVHQGMRDQNWRNTCDDRKHKVLILVAIN